MKQEIVLCGAVLADMCTFSLWAFLQLPSEALVAVHFQWDGSADTLVEKSHGLFIMPLLALGLVTILNISTELDRPRRWTLCTGVVLFAAIHALIVAKALGSSINVASAMIPIIAVNVAAIVLIQLVAFNSHPDAP